MARKRRSGGLFADALRKLTTTLLVVGVGGAVVMGAAGYFIAAQGSVLRGILAAVAAAAIMFVAGAIIAWQVAIREGILTLLSAASLGRRTFDRLLQLTGLQNELEERHALRDLQGKFLAVGPELASETPQSTKGGWIAKQLVGGVNAAVAWLVIRVTRQDAVKLAGEDRALSLRSLSAALADTIDDRVGVAIRRRTRAISLAIGAAGVVAGALAAYAVGQLPFEETEPQASPAASSSEAGAGSH